MRNRLQVVGQGLQEPLPNDLGYFHQFDCLIEFVGKAILLRTPHASDIGMEEFI